MNKLPFSAFLRIAILLFISNIPALLFSQSNFSCGTLEPSAAYMQYYSQLPIVAASQSTFASTSIPLHFWIIQDNAGTNFPTPTIEQIDALIDKTNPFFNFPNSEKFKRCGVSFIKNSDFTISTGTTSFDAALNKAYYNCNALNIYVVQSITTNSPYAAFPFNPFAIANFGVQPPSIPLVNNLVVITPNIVSFSDYHKSTFAHELGHAFGLIHTFNGSNHPSTRENVIRTGPNANCTEKGDLLCDTPADYGRTLTCDSNPNLNCSGSCTLTDDLGVPLTPDYRNTMSYFEVLCRDRFSTQQQEKMSSILYTNPSRSFLLRNVEGIIEAPCSGTPIPLQNANINMTVAFSAGTVLTNFPTCQPYSISTNPSGNYNTCALNPGVSGNSNLGLNYQHIATITPINNTDFRNGVTTFDIALISRHFLDIELLSNSYKKIAADVNGDGEIDAIDQVLIRQLILRQRNDFPNSIGSWRFIPKYHLSNTGFTSSFNSNPFTASYVNGVQTFTYNGTNNYFNAITKNLTTSSLISTIDWSFNGVKMGDVNCSSNGSALRIAQPQHTYANANNKAVTLRTNEEKTVIVKAQYNGLVNNFQVGFKFTSGKVTITAVEKGEFNSANDIMEYSKFDNGDLRALWYNEKNKSKSFKNGITVMKLKVKALTAIPDLLTELKLDPETLISEFYDDNLAQIGVALTLEADGNSTISPSQYTVKAYPNPFSTELTFEINAATKENNAILTVSNTLGLPIYTTKQNLEIGLNTIRINNTAGFPTGVLSYSIKLTNTVLTGTVNKSR